MNDLGMPVQWSEEGHLTIRRAGPGDVNGIWHLLHANYRTRTVPQIVNQLDQFVILASQRRMIGVLLSGPGPENKTVEWIEIHPFYPEQTLRELMLRGVRDAWLDRPKKAPWVIRRRRGSVPNLKGGNNDAPMAGRDPSLQ